MHTSAPSHVKQPTALCCVFVFFFNCYTTVKRRLDAAEGKVQTSLASTLYQDDPERFTKLEFVKTIHVVGLE